MSPQYLSPGVYIEEVDSGSKPIEAAGTSVAAFVGFTEKRPDGNVGEPHLVTSWTQYVNDFGGFVPNAFLPLSVYGYFLNGGGICYIQSLMTANGAADNGGSNVSVTASAAKPIAKLPGKSPSVTASLEVQSQVADSVKLVVEDQPDGSDDLFKFTISGPGGAKETFDGLSLSKSKSARNAVEVINKESKLIKLKEVDTSSPLADRRPAIGTYELAGTSAQTIEKASTTTDVSTEVFQGDLASRVGLAGLEAIDEVTMVCVPDLMAGYLGGQLSREDVKAIQLAVMAHCEQMKDRFAILDSLPDLNAQEVNDWRMKEAGYDSKYAALYYPWIYVANPMASNGGASSIKIPPSGHLAGLYARVDSERGVHKAPANEILRGAIRLETQITKGEQDILNPNGINCIRAFPGRGIRVWGARTVSSDASWRYINVRRLFNMVEESIQDGTQWAVFEPNDPELWAKIRRDIGAFLTNIWRTGALFGLTADQAFFVKCDAENNPPEVRDAGQLFVDIGIAPVKPAEFIIFRIGQSSSEQ